MKKIVFTFKADGRVDIDAQGFHGKGCADASAPFEKVLGVEGERVKKPEFYHAEPTKTRQQTS